MLREGRHHQLRRMFASLGNEVLAIHRTGIGCLQLSSLALREGAVRVLGEAELRALLGGDEEAAADEEGPAGESGRKLERERQRTHA